MWNTPTPDKLASIPRLYETEGTALKDKIIHLHFFIAGTDWYIAEYDGEDLFFGFTILNQDYLCAEWGYVALSELKSIKIGFIEVDNDLHWQVRPAGEIKALKKCPQAF